MKVVYHVRVRHCSKSGAMVELCPSNDSADVFVTFFRMASALASAYHDALNFTVTPKNDRWRDRNSGLASLGWFVSFDASEAAASEQCRRLRSALRVAGLTDVRPDEDSAEACADTVAKV